MKALVKHGDGDGNVSVTEMPVPEIADDEVLIEVKATGVCGSDIHIYRGTYATDLPLILGHEYAGCIVEVGVAVSGWRVGDRVVMENNPHACGMCAVCRKGCFNICPQKRAIGFRSHGCFAEYIKAPANVLHRIPDGLSYEAAALSEPMAVAVHATYERGVLQAGDFVVVFGPGSIGIMSALVAQQMGASRVLVIGVERDIARMRIAEGLGIQTVDSQAHSDWRDLASGADLVVEASGNRNAIRDGLDLVGRAGRFVPVGITGCDSISIPWDATLNKETTVCFSYSSKPDNWRMALALLSSGKIRTEHLISDSFSLEDWEQAFRLTEESQRGKVLLIP